MLQLNCYIIVEHAKKFVQHADIFVQYANIFVEHARKHTAIYMYCINHIAKTLVITMFMICILPLQLFVVKCSKYTCKASHLATPTHELSGPVSMQAAQFG